jgi:glutamate synthase (NADPH/NADH) small chain
VPDPSGFLVHRRRVRPYRPVAERLADHRHAAPPVEPGLAREHAGRCMGCGVPFCHTACPLGNLIPDWSDLVRTDGWRAAFEALDATNNFPELTGLLCPAPCEEACVLALNDEAVTIKQVELAVIERAFAEGWVQPVAPVPASGRSVAVVGSGPAGLAAAQQLTRAGHAVTVFERDDRPGGLLRYGIPDFKLEKWVVDRRIAQMAAEGTRFVTACAVGRDLPVAELRARFDTVVLATGAQRPRELALPGAGLPGVEPAMRYLVGRNRRVTGLPVPGPVSARGRRVVVLGGGDTSADCLGNALREGAASVVEVAHGPTPPAARRPLDTWPEWPFLLRRHPVHDEGGERAWELEPVAVVAADGRVAGVRARRLEFPGFDGVGPRPRAAPTGAEVVLEADLVLVAIGFAGVEDDPLYAGLGVPVCDGTLAVDAGYATPVDGVFAAGDCVRGADLIVTALADGREAARRVDEHLRGASSLPARNALPAYD